MRFVKRNIFTFLCLGAITGYLFVEFDTMRERGAVIAGIIVFVFGMLVSAYMITYILAHKLSFRETIIRMKVEIIIWVVAAGLLLIFGLIELTGILLSGLLLWTILIAGFYWIWLRSGRKK